MNSPLPGLIAKWNAYQRTVPAMMGRKAIEEFTGNFRRQGYQDKSGTEHPWAKRKREDSKRKQKRRRGAVRAILVKTGNLRRSMSVKSLTYNPPTAVVREKMPYGLALNDGDPDRNLPARPFMVESKRLTDAIRNEIIKNVTRIFS